MLHCHTAISANSFDCEQHERLRSLSCEAAGVAYVPSLHSVVLQELRVRGSYLHHKEIKAAQGVKIAAQNLESAVAGTQMLVAGPNDDIEVLKAEVMEDMKDIFGSVDRSGKLLAHSLGSLSVQSSRLCCGVLRGQPAAPLTPLLPPPPPTLFVVKHMQGIANISQLTAPQKLLSLQLFMAQSQHWQIIQAPGCCLPRGGAPCHNTCKRPASRHGDSKHLLLEDVK